MTSPLILQLNEDEATNAAVNLLTSNIPKARVKQIEELSAMEYYAKISTKDIFYVSHGSPYGLKVGQEMATWDQVKHSTNAFQGVRQYVIACHSESMISPRTTAFSGPIDAEIAAAVSVWQHNQIYDRNGITFSEIIDLAIAKDEGNRPIYTLRWGPTEMAWAGIDFAIWLITTVAGVAWAKAALRWGAVCVFAKLYYSALKVATLLYRFAKGWMSFFSFLVAMLFTIGGMIWTILSAVTWWLYVILATMFGIQLASGPGGLTLALIIGGVTLGLLLLTVLNDVIDPNDYYGC
jgi:hypothetical protein